MHRDRFQLHAADRAILEEFRRGQPDYVPLVANRLGIHLPYVETRCDRLVELELLEAVTNEVVYALTERGEAYLAGELNASGHIDAE